MSGHELRETYRHGVLKEIFGDAWRGDRPIDSLGGLMKALVDQAARGDPAMAARTATKINTLVESLTHLDDAYRQVFKGG